MDVSAARPGSVCISVLHTPDVARATEFYTALMDWTAIDVGVGGRVHLLQSRGKTVAGVQQVDGPSAAWVPLVSVTDIDAMVGAAIGLGAVLMNRSDVPDLARIATLRDLEGAAFGVWQPSPHQGAEVMDAVGSLWWVEVLSDDPPRPKQFYSALFGWRVRETAFDPFAAYAIFERDAGQEGGILPIGRDWDVTPHWNSIFAVNDCDATMTRACDLGGSAGFVHTVPAHGRVGGIVDPDGAGFWLRGPVPVAR